MAKTQNSKFSQQDLPRPTLTSVSFRFFSFQSRTKELDSLPSPVSLPDHRTPRSPSLVGETEGQDPEKGPISRSRPQPTHPPSCDLFCTVRFDDSWIPVTLRDHLCSPTFTVSTVAVKSSLEVSESRFQPTLCLERPLRRTSLPRLLGLGTGA